MAALAVALPELDFMRHDDEERPARRDKIWLLQQPAMLLGKSILQLLPRSQYLALPFDQRHGFRARRSRAKIRVALVDFGLQCHPPQTNLPPERRPIEGQAAEGLRAICRPFGPLPVVAKCQPR